METLYFITKIIVAIFSVLLGLVFLYMSVKSCSFLLALKKLEKQISKDIQGSLLRSSTILSGFFSFISNRSQNKAAFGLLGFIIDTVKARFKS